MKVEHEVKLGRTEVTTSSGSEKGGEGEHLPRAALCMGRHLKGKKYGM